MAGDIILCSEKGKSRTFMYIGDNKSMDLDNCEILDLSETTDMLFSLIGYDMFAVIRPAMK